MRDGAILYADMVEKIIRNFREEAPLEQADVEHVRLVVVLRRCEQVEQQRGEAGRLGGVDCGHHQRLSTGVEAAERRVRRHRAHGRGAPADGGDAGGGRKAFMAKRPAAVRT